MQFILNYIFTFFTLFTLLHQTTYASTLKEVVGYTVQTNPQIIEQEKKFIALQQVIRETKADYLPTIDAESSYGPERIANVNTNFQSKNLPVKTIGVTLQENLFNGLGTYSEVKRNQAQALSAWQLAYGTAEDVALSASEAYMNVIKNQIFLIIARQNVLQHEKLLVLIKKRIHAGLAVRSQLYQAKSRLALANSNLLSIRQDLADSKTEYERVIGQLPQNLSPIPEPISDLPKNKTCLVKIALKNNHVLQSAQMDIYAAQAQNRAAKSTLYPKLNVILRANQERDISGVRGTNKDLAAIIQLQYNLFRGGGDVARINETFVQINEASAIRDNAYRQLIEKAELSWNSFEITREKIQYLSEHYQETEKTLKSFYKQYLIGKRTLFDLLDIENEAFTSKLNYVKAKYTLIDSEYRVLNSMNLTIGFLNVPNTFYSNNDIETLKKEYSSCFTIKGKSHGK